MTIDAARFAIERVAGAGSMGTVFLARDTETGAEVALKVLRTGGLEARFEREAEILARLVHPRIVRYLGNGVTAVGERFLALEWIQGDTLRARIARAGLSVHEALEVGIAIAEALEAVHQRGIVHRDVKPSNVLLPGGRVADAKLTDFGIAQLAGDHRRVTRTGDLLGTPAYMAPEQLERAGRVGPACDVFALGALLFECLTGRAPSIAPATSASVRVARPELPASLATEVDRMLSYDPAGRPPDGAAALARLRAVDASHVPPLGPPVWAGRSFAELRTEGSVPRLSEPARATLDVLGRHVPLPLAVLRAQCARSGAELEALTFEEVAAMTTALVEAVARFAAPGRTSTLLGELRELTAGAPRAQRSESC